MKLSDKIPLACENNHPDRILPSLLRQKCLCFGYPKGFFGSMNFLHVMLMQQQDSSSLSQPAPLPLGSGSRLGRVYHHDIQVAQHHVGTLQHKQAVCGLKWAPGGRLLSSGCSDGLLTIWPHDQVQMHRVTH